MIWLSPMTGTEEGSVYFDIRNIELQRNAAVNNGLISGLLGDEQVELWAEITLGSQPQVSILPLWTDEGQVVELTAAIDEDLLKTQLLEAVEKVFCYAGSWETPNLSGNHLGSGQRCSVKARNLAA